MLGQSHILLFLNAFSAATFLPIPSEPLFAGMAAAVDANGLLLVAVASTGNTLGSVVNWLLGRYFLHWQDRKWFPVRPAMLAKASRWYNRYGLWSLLLLAWTPFLGDPLTLVAGVLRVRFVTFLVLVALSKTGRYLFILGAVQHWSG